MKKHIYSCILIIVCFVGIALISCSSQTTVKLDEPYGFTTDGTYLSWENIANANHYIVRVNDDEYETETNEFDLRILSAGYNRVQVRAKKHSTKDYVYQQSDYGEVLYIKKLAAPQSVSFNSESISWQTVEGATEYEVTIENEARAVVYTTKTGSYVCFKEIQDYVVKEGKYYISVSALAENKSSVENNTFLFTTISSAANSGNVLTVSHKMKTPYYINLNTSTQCIEWEASGYARECEVTIKDGQNNIVYSGDAKKYYQKYSIPISYIDTTNLLDGNFTIYIKVLKPENPMWIVDSNKAIYAMEDSEIVEYNIETSFNEALPAVDNLHFYGDTSYITSLRWTLSATSLYEVKLMDNNSTVLHTQIIDIHGVYLVDPYNEFIRKIHSNGEYIFTVKAICEQSNELYIYDGKIMRATKDSEPTEFRFEVNMDTKLTSPSNIVLDYNYGTGFRWNEPSGAAGYLITIKNSDGLVVFNGTQGIYNSNLCYYQATKFIDYLECSGNYTICVQAIGYINIGVSGITKHYDSDVTEFTFNYDKENNRFTNIE